jgi:LL-diaminopimelate aminotransferase
MIIDPAERLNSVKEYYFSSKLKEVRALQASGKPVINLGIGSPDQAPDPSVIDVLMDAASQPDTHAYQPYQGIPELKQAFTDWYARYFGVELSTEQVLPLIGSKEGITHISLAFLNPGDVVLVPELAYPAYKAVAEMVGATVITYPLLELDTGWYPDMEVLRKIDTRKVKLLWLNYPHMPTGTMASRFVFEELVAYAKEKKVLLCHDNPYVFVQQDKDLMSILRIPGGMEVSLELNSLSKSHNMAGWRVGMLAGREDYIRAVLKIKSNVDSGSFRPIQMAAVNALKLDDSWYTKLARTYQERRRVAEQLARVLGCKVKPGQQGLFVWAKIPNKYESGEEMVNDLLYNYNLFVAPGSIFGARGGQYIRISLCVPEEILEKAIGYVNQAQ